MFSRQLTILCALTMFACTSMSRYTLDHDTKPDPAFQASVESIDTVLRAKYEMTTEQTAVGVLDLRRMRLAMIHPQPHRVCRQRREGRHPRTTTSSS